MVFHMQVSLIIFLFVFGTTTIFSRSSVSTNGFSEIPFKLLDFAQKPQVFNWIVGIRRKIHENLELGYEEFETSKLVKAELDKIGIDYKYPIVVTGVVGFVGTRKLHFVAIRADMDALAMQRKFFQEFRRTLKEQHRRGKV